MHSLIERAFIYKGERVLKNPEGCLYDQHTGAWLLKKNNKFLAKSNLKDYPRPGTKKEDMETGEDHKSE